VPEARVCVVERQKRPLPVAAHKVGESSVELSSHYFGVVLGLGEYLRREHFVKNGLRFFPGGGHTHTLEQRTEIGPPQLPKVPSFQLDRGRLENDLRAMDEADGVTLLEGFTVKDIELGASGADHLVRIETLGGEGARTLSARYVVDASGRRAILRNKLGLTRPSGHDANASWWRVKGRRSTSKDLVPASESSWHMRDPDRSAGTRPCTSWGPATGSGTSRSRAAPAESSTPRSASSCTTRSTPSRRSDTLEKSLEWLKKHEPRCYAQIKDMPAEDFLCLRNFSHGSSQCFSKDRWSLVGEAGVFADPFYSPGSDFIAIANSFTTQIVKAMMRGGDDGRGAGAAPRGALRPLLPALLRRGDGDLPQGAPLYGSPRAMAAKVYWDDFNYWSFVCQYFFRRLYELPTTRARALRAIAEEFARSSSAPEAALGVGQARHRRAQGRARHVAAGAVDAREPPPRSREAHDPRRAPRVHAARSWDRHGSSSSSWCCARSRSASSCAEVVRPPKLGDHASFRLAPDGALFPGRHGGGRAGRARARGAGRARRVRARRDERRHPADQRSRRESDHPLLREPRAHRGQPRAQAHAPPVHGGQPPRRRSAGLRRGRRAQHPGAHARHGPRGDSRDR
jgi:hypothetical protein